MDTKAQVDPTPVATPVNRGLKILEIGGNVKPKANLVPGWEGEKILTLDIDPEQKPDIVADAGHLPEELHGQFDGPFASHVLEHFSYWDTERVLRGWIDCLKEGGELHIVVPSWEWTAREVLSEKPSPATLPHSFAGQVNQWDVHLAMFTMRNLRRLFDKLGLSLRAAATGKYHINVGDMGIFEAEEHYIAGIKGPPKLRKE